MHNFNDTKKYEIEIKYKCILNTYGWINSKINDSRQSRHGLTSKKECKTYSAPLKISFFLKSFRNSRTKKLIEELLYV